MVEHCDRVQTEETGRQTVEEGKEQKRDNEPSVESDTETQSQAITQKFKKSQFLASTLSVSHTVYGQKYVDKNHTCVAFDCLYTFGHILYYSVM